MFLVNDFKAKEDHLQTYCGNEVNIDEGVSKAGIYGCDFNLTCYTERFNLDIHFANQLFQRNLVCAIIYVVD